MWLSFFLYQVSQWAAKCKEFEGYFPADISSSWKTLFEDGRQKKCDIVLWFAPPQGVLKLNFDRSFFREHHQGGVLRSYSRSWGYYYSGLAYVTDANIAATFCLLLGCRELKEMNDFKAIIEGDSFLAIQWASTSMTYPWWLADLMEKIHSLCSWWSFLFFMFMVAGRCISLRQCFSHYFRARLGNYRFPSPRVFRNTQCYVFLELTPPLCSGNTQQSCICGGGTHSVST